MKREMTGGPDELMPWCLDALVSCYILFLMPKKLGIMNHIFQQKSLKVFLG